jgi:lysophospholipase L1-like esterase
MKTPSLSPLPLFAKKLRLAGAGAALFVVAALLPLDAEILIKNGESIAFLGDSITANGWSESGGYVKLVVDGLAKEGVTVTPIPAGVGGHKSNDMLARLDKDVLSKKPTWMTLSCGVNDVWHGANGVPLEDYKKNITAIVDRAQAQGIKVVILTATPIFEDLTNAQNAALVPYNEFLRSLAKERNLPLADLSAGFAAVLGKLEPKKDSRYLTMDGVHMNPEGNLIMAKGCLAALGVDAAQRADLEKQWLVQPDSAFISTGNFDPRPRIGITLAQFRAIQKLADKQGVDFGQYNLTLWLKSLGEVLPKYASSEVIDAEKVKKEVNAVFLEKITALAGKP